ncbi:MAG: glycosyltransferase, partial [Bryobacteraceae bacterium]
YFSAPVNLAIRWLERLLAHGSDAICVLSRQQAAEMTGRFRVAAPEKVYIVPLGMDLDPFQRIAPAPAGDRLVVGWLGRFVPVKDIPLLAAVVRETLGRTDRVRFLIAGDGPERAAVEALAAEFGPGRCEWMGWRQDVADVLSPCHVLLQTSRNEGTPVALIQGMAAGRPFVSTPAGGVVDMVAPPVVNKADGCRWFSNGVLAPPAPAALASALIELAENPGLATRMGLAASRFATANYTSQALLESLDQLYSRLLEKRPAIARLEPKEI